jgi:hypothetical protein
VPGGDLMLLFLLLIAISLGFRPSGSTTWKTWLWSPWKKRFDLLQGDH